MGHFYRKEVLKKFKIGQIVTNEELFKNYFNITKGKSVSSFYNFLSELKALDLIQKVDKGKYLIKGARNGD